MNENDAMGDGISLITRIMSATCAGQLIVPQPSPFAPSPSNVAIQKLRDRWEITFFLTSVVVLPVLK